VVLSCSCNGLYRQGYEWYTTRKALILVNAMHITASVFINDDEWGLHADYDKWLEGLAPHAPTSQCQHNRTGEACPEQSEGTTPRRT
jgi:thiamine phosphate synthase YjbQ (UPF0047 family)